jgi:streptomycin 6-kinase
MRRAECADLERHVGHEQNLHTSESRLIIPGAMVERARRLAVELDRSKREEKTLHGDLHHTNILFDEKRGWLAIDAKGARFGHTIHFHV